MMKDRDFPRSLFARRFAPAGDPHFVRKRASPATVSFQKAVRARGIFGSNIKSLWWCVFAWWRRWFEPLFERHDDDLIASERSSLGDRLGAIHGSRNNGKKDRPKLKVVCPLQFQFLPPLARRVIRAVVSRDSSTRSSTNQAASCASALTQIWMCHSKRLT